MHTILICDDDREAFDNFIQKLASYAETSDVNFVVTSSLDVAEASETIKKYI